MPAAEGAVPFTAWFTNLTEQVALISNRFQTVYTEVEPSLSVYDTLTMYAHVGDSVIVTPQHLEIEPSSGGDYAGIPIPLYSMSLYSADDLTPNDPWVTLPPVNGGPTDYDVTLVATNAAGNRAMATTTVTVEEGAPMRVWSGHGRASESVNWLGELVPQSGDSVVFNHASADDCAWDLDVEIVDWLQTDDYTGTITFEIGYPDDLLAQWGYPLQGATFTNLSIAGNAELNGGVWTHPANGANAVNRLAISVGGNFTLASDAEVNVRGRGYSAGNGPGAGTNAQSANARGASHGGQGHYLGSVTSAAPTYGSFVEPLAPGSAATGAGGGALWLDVAGAMIVDGTIDASGTQGSSRPGSAGGSIFLRADTIGGGGELDVRGGGTASDRYGGGGRIAVHLRNSNDFGDLTMRANAILAGAAAAGTIFLQGVNGMDTTAELRIDNDTTSSGLVYTPIPAELDDVAGYVPPLPAQGSVSANAVLIVTNQVRMQLSNDLRLKTLQTVASDALIDLNGFTLYFADAKPTGFPDLSEPADTTEILPPEFGGGEIARNHGRILWDDAAYVAWIPIHAGPNGAILDAAPDAMYDYGSSVSVTADPEPGYAFLRWIGSLPSSQDAHNPTLEFDALPGKHFRAVFASAAASTRTWIGTGGDTSASTAANWYPEGPPQDGEHIVLDGASYSEMTWDTSIPGLTERWNDWVAHSIDIDWDRPIEIEPASWTQTECYNATVTMHTRYPDQGGLTLLTINGNLSVENGVWTHPANGANAVNRLAVSVGGNFTLASDAEVNLRGRGYSAGNGPGAGSTSQSANACGASHGGQGHYAGTVTNAAPTYGSFVEPLDPGSAATGAGGGALWLDVAGAMIVDGAIVASGTQGTLRPGSAGGSIFLRADAIGGGGELDVRGGGTSANQYGGGGRIAVHLRNSNDFGDLTMRANAINTAAAGTIYLQGVEAGETVARLLIDNAGTSSGLVYTPLPSERAVTDGLCPANRICEGARYAVLEIDNHGHVGLTGDLRVADLRMRDSTTRLSLNGYKLYIRALFHTDWGEDEWLVKDGGMLRWPHGTLLFLR